MFRRQRLAGWPSAVRSRGEAPGPDRLDQQRYLAAQDPGIRWRRFTAGAIVISHGGDTEVYLNGQKLFGAGGRIGRYMMHDVTDMLRAALRKGTNTLAVHSAKARRVSSSTWHSFINNSSCDAISQNLSRKGKLCVNDQTRYRNSHPGGGCCFASRPGMETGGGPHHDAWAAGVDPK